MNQLAFQNAVFLLGQKDGQIRRQAFQTPSRNQTQRSPARQIDASCGSPPCHSMFSTFSNRRRQAEREILERLGAENAADAEVGSRWSGSDWRSVVRRERPVRRRRSPWEDPNTERRTLALGGTPINGSLAQKLPKRHPDDLGRSLEQLPQRQSPLVVRRDSDRQLSCHALQCNAIRWTSQCRRRARTQSFVIKTSQTADSESPTTTRTGQWEWPAIAVQYAFDAQ